MVEQEYLTVEEALTAVLAGVSVLGEELVPLPEALGGVLTRAVVARDSLPPFANSSMDGYALRAADIAGATAENPASLRVVADVAAGNSPTEFVSEGTAARIMTGAPLPEGADSVVPVEDTDEPWRDEERPLPEKIAIRRSVKAGDYVRMPGEDIEAGQEVLPVGHLIRPQEIGVLASLGVAEVAVVKRPKVGILATGDELIPVEETLRPGKIRNSNGYTQAAQVRAMGAIAVDLGVAADTKADVWEKLAAGITAGVNLFVSSAGVSVGAYDVVKAVLEEEGNVGFWRVRMRPGKPLAFGTFKGIPYLGLPGNPVSSMVSFETFARPAILKMSGHKDLERPSVEVVMREEVHSDGRQSYIRAVVSRGLDGYTAVTTGGQGSHMMTSLVKANALVVIPEGVKYVAEGQPLTALMIDWPENVF